MKEYICKETPIKDLTCEITDYWLEPVCELIRCKDCAKRTFTKCPMAIGRQSDYDFCSRAERKEK